ncbi:30S ribosomal protein S20 [Virgibacillus sp. W0430]|uniref:30S ribosomal protein S20 n=1 Tax=Virgibacillus sp. W0430 TaxID=3391580 RepID=UPI003F48CD3E
MANLKSAIKRVGVNQKKHALNQSVKSDMRTQIKQLEQLIQANDIESAKDAYNKTVRKIDKAVQKGVIHQNSGNRQKTRLASKINQMGA